MMLRSFLFALLLLASFPGRATVATFFQIDNGGYVPCAACFPTPIGANAFLRFVIMNDDGTQALSNSGAVRVYQDGVLLFSTPWRRESDGGTNTFNRRAPDHFAVGSHHFRLEFWPTSATQPVASTEVTLLWTTAGSPETATQIRSTQNPVAFGNAYGINAHVRALSNPVTGGSVNFTIDGVPFAGNPVPVDATGVASVPAGALPTSVAHHTIAAAYVPDASHAASTSGDYAQAIVPGTSTTTVTSSVNPSVVGESVTFTATIGTGVAGSPGGDVTFTIDGAAQPPVSLGAGSTATITQAFATPGNHTVTAAYSGSPSTSASNGTLTGGQQVRLVPTAALASSANPSSFGEAVTLTATISGTGATPTGTVQFVFDGGNLGTPVALDGSGVAAIVVPQGSLTVGTHPASAIYSGDAGYGDATATLAGGQVVDPAMTTTALLSGTNPSGAGDTVSFTATVTSAYPGTPSGNVVFTVDGTPAATVALDAAGQATFTTSVLAPGSHSVDASYAGSASHAASSATSLTQVVERASTTLSLTASVSPSASGQPVTFTAQLASAYPGMPAGIIVFSLDGVDVATVVFDAASGQASFTTDLLSPGNHTVSARYEGDATYAPSSAGPLAHGVDTAATSTTLAASANPAAAGQAVTFTATVASALAGTPTGSVVFTIDGVAGAPVPLNAGSATFTTSALVPGDHAVSATYSGDASYAGSTSSALVQTIDAAASTTALAASANPSTVGQAVTFTASVTSSYAGTPAGNVVFSIDGASVATVALNGAAQATFTTSSLTVGNNAVTAAYAGNATYAASTSTPLAQVVDVAASSTALASSVNPSASGQAVTLTATVTGAAPGTPTGSVTFMVGGATAATVALNGTGQATFTTSTLAPGNHAVSASYGGSATFAPSASAPLTQAVGMAASTTTLASSANPAPTGQAVTFTATVTGALASTPTGTVTFTIDGVAQAPVALNGAAQATFTTTTLAPGNHVVGAAYGGSATYGASASSALTQVITATTTTTLSSSPNPVVFGQPITFVASVTSTFPGTPTGAVTFVIDGVPQAPVPLNGAAQASLTLVLGAGSHTVVANYGGSAGFASSGSAALGQVVLGQAVNTAPVTIPAASATVLAWLVLLLGLFAMRGLRRE